MTTPTLKRNNRGLLRRAGAALRGERGWLHVEEYHVGDLRRETPVKISGTVAGNILAPKVVVAGLLYGVVAALEVIIEDEGQVWGDVYAHSIRLEGGAKVHGWISTLDEEAYSALRAGDTHLPDPTLPPNVQLPAELQSSRLDGDGPAGVRYAMLRRLQIETATALVARAELEESFENRVVEIAGETLAEATHLREQVATSRSEVVALQMRLDEVQGLLQQREDQNAQQAKELAAVRVLLAERAAAQDELQALFDAQNLALEEAQASKNWVDEQLAASNERADRLAERVNNLESALQASLQHSAEQEDSLLRWQELAEVTEKRANELGQELDNVKLQLTESGRMVELLRGQREKLQAQWEAANSEVESIRKRLAEAEEQWREATSKLVEAEDARVAAERELAETQAALEAAHEQHERDKEVLRTEYEGRPATPAELEEKLAAAERQAARMEASQRQILELQNRLAEAEISRVALDVARQKLGELDEYMNQAIAERDDQILWYKASLGTVTKELESLRQSAAIQHNDITRLTELLHLTEEKLRTAEIQAAELQATLTKEKQESQAGLRQRQLQLEASEAEIEHYHQEIENQRRRLAELQAILVEREVALRRAEESAGQQSQQVARIKQLAGARIQSLEAELKRTQQQLKDLTVYLERRQKKA